MDSWTVIGESSSSTGGDGVDAVLDATQLAAVTGWAQKPEGWCRGTECIPVSFIGDAATSSQLTVAQIGEALGAPVAVDAEHRLAVIGTRPDASASLDSGIAPDVELLGLDGERHTLFEQSGAKTMVVAFSSWCGCRYDLPGWKAIKDELASPSFDIVAVAIDESAELVAPWAEPVDFPVLVDADRTFADTYGLTNVPTIFWLDENRRIVRRPGPEFSDDQFTEVHGVESGPHLDALRRWVLEDELPAEDERPGGDLGRLSDDQRRARTEFRLALELHRRGFAQAAAERVAVADALVPDDFTIWRAGMQLVGDDPFGAEFFDRYTDWQQRHGGPLRVDEP